MNERIKELIKEAGISTAEYYRNLDDPKMFYSKSIVNEWSEDFKQQLNLEPYLRVKKMDESTLEKFAKLIVQECAFYMYENYPYSRYEVNFMRRHMGDPDWNKPIKDQLESNDERTN